jgi:hypothetical protein
MKTAVEWLLNEQHLLNIDDSLTKKQYLGKRKKMERKALEMMKEQLIESYEYGKQNGIDSITNINSYIIGEYYFNQTYKQNKGQSWYEGQSGINGIDEFHNQNK